MGTRGTTGRLCTSTPQPICGLLPIFLFASTSTTLIIPTLHLLHLNHLFFIFFFIFFFSLWLTQPYWHPLSIPTPIFPIFTLFFPNPYLSTHLEAILGIKNHPTISTPYSYPYLLNLGIFYSSSTISYS